jgi:hypothetical protein
MSDTAWTIFVMVLFVFAVLYWIGLAIYIFYDDLVELFDAEKAPSVTIDASQPDDPAERFRNLRRPVK